MGREVEGGGEDMFGCGCGEPLAICRVMREYGGGGIERRSVVQRPLCAAVGNFQLPVDP